MPLPGEYKSETTFRSFYEKGEALDTPSGKIEFFSQRLHNHLPEDKERAPVPCFAPSLEGHMSPLAEKYTLLLIAPHARYSFHTQGENASWIRSIPLHRVHKNGYDYWPIQIHPSDAKPRRIKNGDLVKAYNDRAAVILIARVTQKIQPGAVFSATAGSYDPVEPGKLGSIDRGGAVNLLIPARIMSKNAPGQVTQGLIQIEKYEE